MKKIFICYSHQDEAWKDRLVKHLNALKGHYDVWDDSRIEIGVDWKTEIESSLNEAVVAILMVSVDFLNSKFISEIEFPRIIERHEKEGLKVIPVFVKPCPWERVPLIAKFQGIPRKGKTLAEYDENHAERILADLAKEIYDIDNNKKVDSTLQSTVIPSNETKSIVLEGHEGEVFCVAVTPDGKKIVSGSEDETMKVWDVESFRCLATLKNFSDVYGIDVTPNGKMVVGGLLDKTLRVWDLETGKLLSILKGHTKCIGPWAVAAMPDGKRVVSGSHDGTIKVWNIFSERCLKTIEGHKSEIIGIALTSEGDRVISSSSDSSIKLWDLESGQCLVTFEGHTKTVIGIAVTPYGKRVVSGSYDRTLKVWDIESGQCLATFEGHTGCVYGVVVTPDNKWVVSSSQDKTVKVWDLETGECQITFEGHTDSVNGVAVSPDGKWVVSTSGDKTLIVWELPEFLRTGRTNAIKINPDSWAVLFHKGKSLAALGRHDEALEAYKKAIDINPDAWALWFHIGKSLAALGRHDEALEAYKKAIDINPDAWVVWFHIGKSLDALGRHDEALEAYKKAEKIKQDHPEALTKEGVALEKLGREKDSEGDKGDTMVEKKTDVGVFISYIRENKDKVHRLCEYLQKSGIKVWIDKDKIKPGHFWPDVIRDAIKKGSFFIACFSKEFNERIRSHMHEELTLAIEELRKRPKDRAWFIPVLFSGEVPNITISDGVTIRHIQWVDLSQGWDNGINEILSVVSPTAR
jgi:WD40 repeat protein